MEKHETKRDPVKLRDNISQLQIVRKVHSGFGLAGREGEPAAVRLQATGKRPPLGPAVPTGAVALQMLRVPVHVALAVGKEGAFLARRFPESHPWGCNPPQIFAISGTLRRGQQRCHVCNRFQMICTCRQLPGKSFFSCFLCLRFAPFGRLSCFPRQGNIRWVHPDPSGKQFPVSRLTLCYQMSFWGSIQSW